MNLSDRETIAEAFIIRTGRATNIAERTQGATSKKSLWLCQDLAKIQKIDRHLASCAKKSKYDGKWVEASISGNVYFFDTKTQTGTWVKPKDLDKWEEALISNAT